MVYQQCKKPPKTPNSNAAKNHRGKRVPLPQHQKSQKPPILFFFLFDSNNPNATSQNPTQETLYSASRIMSEFRFATASRFTPSSAAMPVPRPALPQQWREFGAGLLARRVCTAGPLFGALSPPCAGSHCPG